RVGGDRASELVGAAPGQVEVNDRVLGPRGGRLSAGGSLRDAPAVPDPDRDLVLDCGRRLPEVQCEFPRLVARTLADGKRSGCPFNCATEQLAPYSGGLCCVSSDGGLGATKC